MLKKNYSIDHLSIIMFSFVSVKGYCMRGDLCEWDHGVDPVVLEDATLTRVLAIPPPVPGESIY